MFLFQPWLFERESGSEDQVLFKAVPAAVFEVNGPNFGVEKLGYDIVCHFV